LGSELTEQLEAAGAPFRAAYFSPQQADAARARGIDAILIDYNRPKTLRMAFCECDKLFLLKPTMPDQTQLELNGVEATKQAGIQHIVKPSIGCERRGVHRRSSSSGR
jgi:uncharacterized protein YbjT (DUF2867 family)